MGTIGAWLGDDFKVHHLGGWRSVTFLCCVSPWPPPPLKPTHNSSLPEASSTTLLWIKLLLWSGPKCLEHPTEGKLAWNSKATGTAQWTQNQQKKVTQTLHFPSFNLPKEGSLGRPIFLLGQVQICLTTLGKLDTTSKGDELGVLPVKSNQEHCHFWDSSFHQKILWDEQAKPLRCPHFTWRVKMLLPITITSKCIWLYLEQYF